MPKERVYGNLLPFGTPENPGPGRSVVDVLWGNGDMQIVSKCVDSQTGDHLVKDELPGGIHYTDGFYVNLDRKGVNDLIRHLRRARDKAFGRDE